VSESSRIQSYWNKQNAKRVALDGLSSESGYRTYDDRLHLQHGLGWFAFYNEFTPFQSLYSQLHFVIILFSYSSRDVFNESLR
jgi:hypothetical protein